MARFPELTRDQMTDAQKRAYDGIVSGPRGGARGPFNVLRSLTQARHQVIKEDELGRLFAKLSQLGKLQVYEGSKGDAHISLTTQAGKVITASYIASASFEKGPAEVTIRLISERRAVADSPVSCEFAHISPMITFARHGRSPRALGDIPRYHVDPRDK
jgi:hypothetical protein